MSLPIRVERLSTQPIALCALFPGAAQVIPLGQISGPPGPLAERLQVISYVVDAGGAPIAVGLKGDIYIPYDCNIVSWLVIGDQVGGFSVEIDRDTIAQFPPSVADSIVGATPPKLINQQINSGTADDWQRAIPAGSILRYRVLTATVVQRVTIALTVERT